MKGRFVIVLGLVFASSSWVFGADPVPVAPTVERNETAPPGIVPTAEIEKPKPRPVEKPKPVEQPKPVEKPRPTVIKDTRPPIVEPGKSQEPPAAAVAEEPAPAAMTMQDRKMGGYSLSCLALAFAMLILGVAAGFLWRHLMSRHKLGGMTVRIGTWRGIP